MNNLKFICLISLLIISCRRSQPIDGKYNNYINSNFNDYEHIYGMVNDSLQHWISDSLNIVQYFLNKEPYKVDSVMIFSSDSLRMFTTINKKTVLYKDSYMDYILEFGGARIDGRWYFFFIPVSMPVYRGLYQDSIHAPYSWDELSYIAHSHRFGSALIQHDDGSFEANEEFFRKKFFSAGVGVANSTTLEYRNNRILKNAKSKYNKKISPQEIEEIRQEMDKRKKPPEPEQKPKSWLERIFGKEEKLFETDDWNNRRKK